MADLSTTHRPPPRATLTVLAALVLVLAACSATSTTSEPPASQAAASEAPASQPPASAAASQAAGGTTVTISGLAFSVAEIAVPVGNVTFVNEDSVTHVLAEGENGKEVESPRVQKVSVNGGSQGDMEFTVAGDYHITCLVHPTMNIEVHAQ